MTIGQVWQAYTEYWLKHEPDMTDPCLGESKEEVEKTEEKLNIKFPEEFKESLQLTFHRTKKCDGYDHSWFGSRTGIQLYWCDFIVQMKDVLVEMDVINDYENIYFDDIAPYNGDIWPCEWIPIAQKSGIFFFLDLRKNIGEQYGQVLAVIFGIEDENGNWISHFVRVGHSFGDFLEQALVEVKKNQGLYEDYFLKLMHLPEDYIDDDWGN